MIYIRSCFLCIESLPHRARAAEEMKRASTTCPLLRFRFRSRVQRDTDFQYSIEHTRFAADTVVVTNCAPGESLIESFKIPRNDRHDIFLSRFSSDVFVYSVKGIFSLEIKCDIVCYC